MKLPRLVINSFQRRCQLKVDNVEAFLEELKGQENLTPVQLEQFQRLTTALTDQWGCMETAWLAHLVPAPASTEEAALLQELDAIVVATGKAVTAILAASEQFVTGQSGESVPEPVHVSMPTTQIQGQIGLGAEVTTGAVAGAAMVAQVATEDTATFRTNAIDVKAETLAEAGVEYSMEAEGRMGELGEFSPKTKICLSIVTFSKRANSRETVRLGFGGTKRRREPRDAVGTTSHQMI